jgi:hypothetical protein
MKDWNILISKFNEIVKEQNGKISSIKCINSYYDMIQKFNLAVSLNDINKANNIINNYIN